LRKKNKCISHLEINRKEGKLFFAESAKNVKRSMGLRTKMIVGGLKFA